MEKLKKFKIPLFFLIISLITIPIINGYINLIKESLKINVTNVTFILIWVIVNGIIALTTENIILTKKNSKIEVEGINLKRKDGTYGTADWGTREEIEEYLKSRPKNLFFNKKEDYSFTNVLFLLLSIYFSYILRIIVVIAPY